MGLYVINEDIRPQKLSFSINTSTMSTFFSPRIICCIFEEKKFRIKASDHLLDRSILLSK